MGDSHSASIEFATAWGLDMKLRYKILGSLLAIGAVGVAGLAAALGYESTCESAPVVAASTDSMAAVTARCYGSSEVLQLEQLPKPELADDRVLVRVHAASINPLDWHEMTGAPYLMRLSMGIGKPEDFRVGVDYAGVIEAVGKDVTRFKPGDEVFGGAGGAMAEYLSIGAQRNIVLKPANVSFEQAGSVGVAGITALQALRDHGELQAGQRVLINGASGGVGTFAVQIAKALGAEVTGICSGRNVEMVKSIGADHVINYKQDDYTQRTERYDLIVDMIGNHSLSANLGVLADGGKMVIVGGSKSNKWIDPIPGVLWAVITQPFRDHEAAMMIAEFSPEDLQILADMMSKGQVTPVIDRRFALDQVTQAMDYLETGRARGKVVMTLN